MRNLATLIFFVPFLAFGQSSIPPASPSAAKILEETLARKDRQISAQLLPDDELAADYNWQTLKACNDAALLSKGKITRVSIAPGVFYINKPWQIDCPSLQVTGSGPDQTIIRGVLNYGGSLIIAGVPNLKEDELKGVALDLFGRLDRTAVPVADKRYGLILGSGKHLAFGATTAARGWKSATGVSVEFALDLDTVSSGVVPIVGVSNSGSPHDFMIFGAGDAAAPVWMAYVRTVSGIKGLTAPRNPNFTGVHRYCYQYDVSTGTGSWFIDGAPSTTGVIGTPGEALASSDPNLPLLINAIGGQANIANTDSYNVDKGHAVALCGLMISNKTLYNKDGTRKDGGAQNDLTRYFTPTSASVLYLPLTESRSTVEAGTVTAIATGSVNEKGLILTERYQSPYSAVGGTKLKDLTLQLVTGTGECFTQGFALYVQASGVHFEGGAHGVGTWRWGANYRSFFDNCEFSGQTVADIYFWLGTGTFNRCFFWSHPQGSIGGCTVWQELGDLTITDSLFSYPGDPLAVFRSYAGKLTLKAVNIDFEDKTALTQMEAYIWATANNAWGQLYAGGVFLEDFNAGSVRAGKPVVLLDGNDPVGGIFATRPPFVVFNYSDCPALVKVVGNSWSGTVDSFLRPEIKVLSADHPEKFIVDGKRPSAAP